PVFLRAPERRSPLSRGDRGTREVGRRRVRRPFPSGALSVVACNVLSSNLFVLRRPVVFALHLVLIPLGFLAAFALRFDVPVPETYWGLFLRTAPILLVARLVSFAAFGLYRGWWRHVGMKDLVALLQAVSVSTVLFLAALFFTQQLAGFPRSLLILDWILAVGLFGG